MAIIFPPIAKPSGDRVFYAPGTKQYRRMVGAKGAIVAKQGQPDKSTVTDKDCKEILDDLKSMMNSFKKADGH